MLFRRKTLTVDGAHAAASAYDKRTEDLIARLHAARATLRGDDAQGLGDIARLIGDLLSYSDDWLADAAKAYREGSKPEWSLDKVGQALEMADGLLGRAGKTKLEKIGHDLRDMYLSTLGVQGDEDGLRLHGELLSTAISQVAEAYKDLKNGYSSLFDRDLEKAITAMERAPEALRPDSAGVRFVGRIDALKTKMRLVKAA